jgi:hypothetical protein
MSDESQSLDFGLAALLLVGVYVLGELADTTRIGRVAGGLMAYAAAFAVLRGIRASRAVTRWSIGLLALGSLLRVLSAASDADALRVLASVIHLGIALAAPFLVLRFILRAGTVTLDVVFAGITLYLLIGILFGVIYTDIAWTNPAAFSPAQPVTSAGTSALFYFSFIALTTVGFGDIAAASDLTRALVVVEALTGQLLLVVLISRLVGAVETRRT